MPNPITVELHKSEQNQLYFVSFKYKTENNLASMKAYRDTGRKFVSDLKELTEAAWTWI